MTSVCIIAILAAFGPCSIANITERSIKNDIEKTLNNNKLQIKNSFEEKSNDHIFNELQEADIKNLEAQMEYLSDNFGIEKLSPYFIDFPDSIDDFWEIRSTFSDYLYAKYPDTSVDVNSNYVSLYVNDNTKVSLLNTSKYHYLSQIRYYGGNDGKVQNDFTFKPEIENADFEVKIPARDLYLKLKNTENIYADTVYTFQSGQYLFYLYSVEIDYTPESDSFSVSYVDGILFY
ncbi:hypothetical protein FACS1894178_5400 [Bacteroidia bacterium]|nr:hypothetical protein FACS1894178_5400 [Bacteroidia bacterium]